MPNTWIVTKIIVMKSLLSPRPPSTPSAEGGASLPGNGSNDLLEALESDRGQAALRKAVVASLADPAGQHFLRQAIFSCLWEVIGNVDVMIRTMSAVRSAQFVTENIPLHLGKHMTTLRQDAVTKAPAGGLFLEFGVFKGHWITFCANQRPTERFYGFDSFEGLPEAWSDREAGHFDLGGQLPTVPANVTLVKGWFNETLPPFLEKYPEKVSFIHMDCDLYSSTMTVLEALRERLQVGTQIVLDDFMLNPGWEKEEQKAFFDFTKREKIEWEYTGWQTGSPGCSASVVLTKV